MQQIKAHKEFIYCLTILVDGCVATGSGDNTIKIWNPKNGDLMKTLEGHRFPVRAL
jgi:WD40 repeat protein